MTRLFACDFDIAAGPAIACYTVPHPNEPSSDFTRDWWFVAGGSKLGVPNYAFCTDR